MTRVSFTFDSADFHGKGIVRLREGRAWTLLTSAQELIEHPEPKGDAVPWVRSTAEGRHPQLAGPEDRPSGRPGDDRTAVRAHRRRRPGWYALGARLKATRGPHPHRRQGRPARRSVALALPLPLPSRPGLVRPPPYLPFPDDWPVFTPKDKMGDWLEHYVGIMDLDYWTNSECVGRPTTRIRDLVGRGEPGRNDGHAAAHPPGARHGHVGCRTAPTSRARRISGRDPPFLRASRWGR